jgi:hypothetical protein
MSRPAGKHETSRRALRRARANRPLPPAIEPVSLAGAQPEFDDPAQMTAQDLRCQSPVRPYLPELPKFVPNPLDDPEQAITEPRTPPGTSLTIVAGGWWALRLPCGGPGPLQADCPAWFGSGDDTSFTDLYTRAAAAGWQQDAFGVWTCPDCQMLPTWRTPYGVRFAQHPGESAVRELGLINKVQAVSGDWASLVETVRDAGDATGVTPQPQPAVAA